MKTFIVTAQYQFVVRGEDKGDAMVNADQVVYDLAPEMEIVSIEECSSNESSN